MKTRFRRTDSNYVKRMKRAKSPSARSFFFFFFERERKQNTVSGNSDSFARGTAGAETVMWREAADIDNV